MNNKQITLLTLLIFIIFAASGCSDAVDIENRGIVISLGIDTDDVDSKGSEIDENQFSNPSRNRFKISAAIQLYDEKNDGDSELITVTDNGIAGALTRLNGKTSKKLYFGLTRLVLLSEKILSDETLFREVIDYLERDQQFNRKLLVLAVMDNPDELLENTAKSEQQLGLFVGDYYKNNGNYSAETMKLDMQSLIRRLRETGCVIIPEINSEDDTPNLCGAVVISNFEKSGRLSGEDMQRYLLATGNGKDSILSCKSDSAGFQNEFYLKISSMNSKMKISEADGALCCDIDIIIKGGIVDYVAAINDGDELNDLFAEKVTDEIYAIIDCFGKINSDGLDIKTHMLKYNTELYEKYFDNFSYQNIRFHVKTTVDISANGFIEKNE